MSRGSTGEARRQAMRRQLFQAAGIVTVTRHSLASNLEGLDNESAIDALAAAASIIDEVAGELEA